MELIFVSRLPLLCRCGLVGKPGKNSERTLEVDAGWDERINPAFIRKGISELGFAAFYDARLQEGPSLVGSSFGSNFGMISS